MAPMAMNCVVGTQPKRSTIAIETLTRTDRWGSDRPLQVVARGC
jgi:hypothetical protein